MIEPNIDQHTKVNKNEKKGVESLVEASTSALKIDMCYARAWHITGHLEYGQKFRIPALGHNHNLSLRPCHGVFGVQNQWFEADVITWPDT
jgi:hypothetical protein